mgnify:CR=1 FL=1
MSEYWAATYGQQYLIAGYDLIWPFWVDKDYHIVHKHFQKQT